MFDRVLDAANRRLRPMTKDRYRLQRDEGGSGKSYRGLGISVFDVETGKARAPSTLSGGETFIAALALALGLSDIVESVSGKVHLDTIFIDEGFGSLDVDGRKQMIEQLKALEGTLDRVILVSHHEAFNEAFTVGYHIEKSNGSSRAVLRHEIVTQADGA